MEFLRNLAIVTILSILSICLLQVYGQNWMNNTANTIENTVEENRNIDLNNVNKGTNKMEGIDSTELLTQVGEAAKKIAIGGANVLSNISGEIKKGLQ
jgi:hypothetical protein